jgi:hypothetical protein
VIAAVDTLKLSKRFREAGIPENQAEIFAEALRETQEAGFANLATKTDIADLRGEQTLLKWMLGFVLVLLLAVFWQLFTMSGKVSDLGERLARIEQAVVAGPKAP